MYNALTHLWYNSEVVYTSLFRVLCTITFMDVFNRLNYTTKIYTFVCPPHISETVAVRIMKLAHRSRIASTTKKII